jgi:hypothetical protein
VTGASGRPFTQSPHASGGSPTPLSVGPDVPRGVSPFWGLRTGLRSADSAPRVIPEICARRKGGFRPAAYSDDPGSQIGTKPIFHARLSQAFLDAPTPVVRVSCSWRWPEGLTLSGDGRMPVAHVSWRHRTR